MKPLNDRAKLRLRLAAALIGGEQRSLKLDRKNFYPEILKVISGLPADRQASIRENVDWLEEYENASTDEAKPSPATLGKK